tara:strand:- start:211 stop:501 length:291 start_codon:yes stop_codon:yes gene_type:complete
MSSYNMKYIDLAKETDKGEVMIGTDLYIYGLPPSPEYTKNIVQMGIKRVIMPKYRYPDIWTRRWSESEKIYNEAGVEYVFGNYQSSVEYTESPEVS